MKASSKERIIPLWAISNAANECVKYKLASDKTAEEKVIIESLRNEGYTIVNANNYGTNMKPKRAESAAWDHIVFGVDMAFGWNNQPTEELIELLESSMYSYFLACEGATIEDAKRVTKGLFEEALEKVRDGDIGKKRSTSSL